MSAFRRFYGIWFVLAYLLFRLIGFKTGTHLESIVAVALFFYIPGSLMIDGISDLGLGLGYYGRISLSFLYSFCLTSVIAIIAQTKFGFNSDQQIYILLISVIIFNCLKFVPYLSRFSKKTTEPYRVKKTDFYPIAILLIALIVLIVINPLAQNADLYLTNLFESIRTNQNVLNIRQVYVAYFNFSGRFLKLNLTFLFRNIFILQFFASTFVFFDYLKHNLKSERLIAFSYLMILAPSVILTEINIIRPQTALLFMTLPIMVITIESIRERKIFLSIVAGVLSLIAFKYHELSSILLLMVLIAFTYNLFINIFVEKVIKPFHIILAILFIYPYVVILNILSQLSLIPHQLSYAFSFMHGFTFRWWFLNNYSSIDGANLSWTGLNALMYYLYNGILVLIFSLLIAFIRTKNQARFIKVIPLSYVAIYLIFAELLPRFGLYFLPNRAWVHLMFALIVLVVIQLKKFDKKKLSATLQIALSLLILVGYAGSLYVAKNNVEEVFREELKGAKFIREKTAQDSLIISSQENYSLVRIFFNRNYSRAKITTEISKDDFEKIIDDKIKEVSKEKILSLSPKILQKTQKITDGTIVFEEEHVVQNERKVTISPLYTGKESVYFYYSYAKLGGLNSQREYKKNLIDPINKDNYKDFGYEIFYSDEDCLILKLR